MSDLTLEAVDRSGAIAETFDQLTGGTRAEFLGKAVIGGGALAAALETPALAQPRNTAKDIASDDQYAARNMIQRLDVDNGDELLEDVGFTGIVPVFGDRSQPIRSLGPDLGEHTREVLGSILGWSEERIERMLDETQEVAP